MRRYRLKAPETIYHISSRGNRGQTIFSCDPDRLLFLDLVGQVIKKMEWRCHAYCLMTNHYHLLVETGCENLSEGIQELNSRYARKYNQRFVTGGHLFQDRFDSSIVDSDEYFMIAASYILLNPVKARLVRHPNDWAWSSYHQTTGGGSSVDFIDSRTLLNLFAGGDRAAKENFSEFVEDCLEVILDERPTPSSNGRRVLSSRTTLEEIFGDLEMNRRDRNRLVSIAYITHGYTMEEIASFIGMSTAGIWKILNKSK